MITTRPFAAIRPTRDKVSLVGSRSYLEYSDEDLKDKLENNPFTFLHIINPDYQAAEKLHGRAKFRAVRAAFDDFVRQGIFEQEAAPAYYLYRQRAHGKEYQGIIAAVSIADYTEGRVKVHEHTLTEREEMFRDYLDETGFNAEPVLLTHPVNLAIERIMERHLSQRAEYEFTSTDRVTHHLWVLNEKEDLAALEEAYASMPAVYIADGHHRTASSALLADMRAGNAAEAHHFFMAMLVPETHLKIWEFNRIVQCDLPPQNLLTKLEADFFITRDPQPPHGATIRMWMDGAWFGLESRPGTVDLHHPVKSLACQVLSDLVLDKIMGITNLKTDKRVSFVPGTETQASLLKIMERKRCNVAFVLPPVSFEQLKAVADAGLIMPPKSTYIEPKIRSGMTIYPL